MILKMNTEAFTGVVLMLLIMILPGSAAAASEQATAAKEDANLPHPEVARISCEELRKMLDTKQDVVVVDTRDALSYGDAHVPTAINVYYNPISDPSERQMTLVALPMNRPIVIYCP